MSLCKNTNFFSEIGTFFSKKSRCYNTGHKRCKEGYTDNDVKVV